MCLQKSIYTAYHKMRFRRLESSFCLKTFIAC